MASTSPAPIAEFTQHNENAAYMQAGAPVIQRVEIGENPKMSAGMIAVLILTLIYYAADLRRFLLEIWMRRSVSLRSRAGTPESLAKEQVDKEYAQSTATTARLSTCTGNIIMISILIVFARLRAKVDLEGTAPPEYAKNSYYAVVGVVAAQAALALMPKPPKTEAVAISVCAEVINALLTLAFYVLVIVVMGSIFALTKEKPEPMSGLGATL